MSILFATLPQLSDQTVWLIVAGMGIIALYLIMRPRKKKDPLTGPPKFPSSIRQRDVEEQMSNLIVELAGMARQITAQLDTRAAKLEVLLKEADQMLTRLETATAATRKLSTDDGRLAPAREVDQVEIAALVELQSIADSAAIPIAAPSPNGSRHADIYVLADEGRSSQEIARLLNRPAGEIELILAVRRR